jgi:arylsulfatase A-like enzyme
MNLGAGKSHHYEFDTRLPFLARGPLIVPGSAPTFLASNVDVAPTFVELSGWQDGSGARVPPLMDGRSLVPQLLTLPAEQQHEATVSSSESGSNAAPLRAWRSKGLIEFTGLSGWPAGYPRPAKRLNDCPNNTWRALRYKNGGPVHGFGSASNVLYAEFTEATDWHYDAVNFRELYDLDADPYQLTNLWPNATAEVQASFMGDMDATWGCVGQACP